MDNQNTPQCRPSTTIDKEESNGNLGNYLDTEKEIEGENVLINFNKLVNFITSNFTCQHCRSIINSDSFEKTALHCCRI